MSKVLQRDIYNLHALGYTIEQAKQPDADLLAASRNLCIYWINHLYNWNYNSYTNYSIGLQDRGIVNNFIREKYLYWPKALLSLCRSISQRVLVMAELEALIQVILRLMLPYLLAYKTPLRYKTPPPHIRPLSQRRVAAKLV
jgi:hypothetical protein